MLNYQINQLDCDQTKPNHPDCVTTIHYTVTKTRGDFTASTYGTVGIGLDESATYTPYANLTKDQVIGWLNLDEDALNASLDAQLDAQETPAIVGKTAPWVVQE